MPSISDRPFSLTLLSAGPVGVLPKRDLRVVFPLPSPLLRAIGDGESVESGLWSDWLKEFGWAWEVSRDACVPAEPLVNLWLSRGEWPKDFDPRVLALAVALQLRVDGQPLSESSGDALPDMGRTWRMISAVSKDVLGEVLALAILRANRTVFNFNSVAPDWPGDVGRVLAERRPLRDGREPSPKWLKTGYAMLDETFGMLRSMGENLQECTEIWSEFTAATGELPLAFEMAYWWEATYCLSERHVYEDAEAAQNKVASLAHQLGEWTGLIDPMWHHQQGRLYYYAGNHELALSEFLREYHSHGDDLRVSPMLFREIANVLSDLACLNAARGFAEKSVSIAKSQGQRVEQYKSLGRLAEVYIKLGDFSLAERLLNESLNIQQKIVDNNRSTAQTLTYLGHVAILKGDFDEAANWYDLATARDADKSSLPYIMMGRFALAAACNPVDLDLLWNSKSEQIAMWLKHQTLVLPAAVAVLAASRRVNAARTAQPMVVRALLDSRYAIEAACMVQVVPESEQSRLVSDIIATLNVWKRSLKSLSPTLTDMVEGLNGPTLISEEIRTRKFWENPRSVALGYPMTLVKRA